MSFLTGSAPKVNFTPTQGSGGGLNTKFIPGSISGGTYTTTADPTRTAAVGDVANTYTALGNETAGLRGTVTPGYNTLLNTQLNDINDQAHAAIGNLQQNLQSRRVLGSSFGQDTLARARAQVAKTRADTISSNFLSSLDANNKLLQQEYAARTAAANTGLNELNLEAGVANGLIGSTNSIMAQNAQVNAKLEADSQAGAGKFIGNILGTLGGSIFNPSSGGSSGGSNNGAGTFSSLMNTGNNAGPIASVF